MTEFDDAGVYRVVHRNISKRCHKLLKSKEFVYLLLLFSAGLLVPMIAHLLAMSRIANMSESSPVPESIAVDSAWIRFLVCLGSPCKHGV
jgi:hypothetical protein